MPGTLQSACRALLYLNLMTTLHVGVIPTFRLKTVEAQRGETTYLRSHSKSIQLELKPTRATARLRLEVWEETGHRAGEDSGWLLFAAWPAQLQGRLPALLIHQLLSPSELFAPFTFVLAFIPSLASTSILASSLDECVKR